MRLRCAIIAFAIAPVIAIAQDDQPSIQAQLDAIDAAAAHLDLKIAVVDVMAQDLGCHRNHLLLQRRNTGMSFGWLYATELRSMGLDDDALLKKLRLVNSRIAVLSRQLPASPQHFGLFVATGVDQNRVGTLYFAVPEISYTADRFAIRLGIPYYRAYGDSTLNTGAGDAYLTTLVKARSRPLEVTGAATVGVPTGDKDKGLGAGKPTVDVTATLARRLESLRPWLTIGLANSISNNVGYRRPYVTDGNAAHLTGGVDFVLQRRINLGLAGFVLRPFGAQNVYSDMVSPSAGSAMSPSEEGMVHMGPGMPSGVPDSMPFYERAQHTTVSSRDLKDHGGSIWISVPVRSAFVFTVAIARSVPFSLTTARVGIGLDVGRLFKLPAR